MKIVINDLSFQYPFYDEQTALEKLHEFIRICKVLEKGTLKNVEKIVSCIIDPSVKITPQCSLYTLLQRFETKDEKRYLLGLLVSRPTVPQERQMKCTVNGKESFACLLAVENMLVSLLSNPIFSGSEIAACLDDQEITIRNISKDVHIDYYRNELGKRIYAGNDKKHKKDRVNSYGKGKEGSPMDLEQEEAQELLDRAICINGRLYARKNDKNYAFQNTRDVIYHGYIAEDLGDHIKKELDKQKW
ncbi:MAG: hypothetical protein ACI4DV_01765 [Lachnospiraceae bacterium]